jgi:uncharacterized coiled-coil protein SlyX
MLIFYLAILIITIGISLKLLIPEIRKSSSSMVFSVAPQADDTTLKIEKLDMMLAEKNKTIEHLREELKILHAQSQDFEKIKTLMEEEIQHLKGQNRMAKSEIPADQPKEDPTT